MRGGGGGEFGDQVGEGDVGEVPGGEGQEDGDVGVPGRGLGGDSAEDDGGGGGEVEGEGGAACPARVDEDPEVAQFLGDLVGGQDEPGHQSEFGADGEGGADRQAVDEVMEPVGDQDQVPQRGGGQPAAGGSGASAGTARARRR